MIRLKPETHLFRNSLPHPACIIFLFFALFAQIVSASFNDYDLEIAPDNIDKPDLYIGNDDGLRIREAMAQEASATTSGPATPEATSIVYNQIIHGALQPGGYHLYALTNISSKTSKSVYVAGNICTAPDSDPYGNNMFVISSTSLKNITSAISSWDNIMNMTTAFAFDHGLGSAQVKIPTSNSPQTLYVLVQANSVQNFGTFPGQTQFNAEDQDNDNKKKRSLIDKTDFEIFDDFEDYAFARPDPVSLTKRLIKATAANKNDTWQYEIGISTGEAIFQADDEQNIFLVDTDFAHALLTTANMSLDVTEDDQVAPYTDKPFYKNPRSYYDIHVFSNDSGTRIIETLGNSYCAISKSSEVALNTGNSNVSISTRGDIGFPKIQYFLNGLNISSSYIVFITQPKNLSYVVNGQTNVGLNGGTAFGVPAPISTKKERNCQLVYNMSMCKDTAYAVPGNATTYTPEELSLTYDNRVRELYQGFDKSMQQIPCANVSEFQKYSIMRTCDDCRDSYRKWLCAVTIPRCEDFSTDKSYLAVREMNTSRDDFIDSEIKPGPYKEMLPCIDMCYAIVQDCPAEMGFACPDVNSVGFKGYYMTMVNGSNTLTCNFPGAVYRVNGAQWLVSQLGAWHSMVVTFVIVLMVI